MSLPEQRQIARYGSFLDQSLSISAHKPPEADALQARYETVLPPQAHDQQAERTPVVAPGVVCVRNVQGATLNPRNARVLCGPPAAKNGTGAYHDLSGITPNACRNFVWRCPPRANDRSEVLCRYRSQHQMTASGATSPSGSTGLPAGSAPYRTGAGSVGRKSAHD